MGENTTYEDRALHVKMFGGFDMTYLGKTLLGKKSGESQFVYMMQILLHNRETGLAEKYLRRFCLETEILRMCIMQCRV